MRFDIKGLIAPPLTPMNEDGSVNLAPIAEYASYLKSQCVENLFVLGTTGEGQNLTVDERKRVAEQWMKEARDKFQKIILQVGAGNLQETIDLAKHAESIKADAIAVAPPTYFKPATVAQLGDYLAEVAKVVPAMPVLYYHLPERTGVDFKMIDLLDDIAERIPNFAGMKFVTFDMGDFGRCQYKYGDRLTLAYGKDENLIAAALFGGTSFVGATFNHLGKTQKKLLDLCAANDFKGAAEQQLRVVRASAILSNRAETFKPVIGKMTGINFGPARMPAKTADKVEVDGILKELDAIGYFRWN